MRLLGRYNVVMHVNSSFLQMFLWERFRALAPKQIEYSLPVSYKARRVASLMGVKNI